MRKEIYVKKDLRSIVKNKILDENYYLQSVNKAWIIIREIRGDGKTGNYTDLRINIISKVYRSIIK